MRMFSSLLIAALLAACTRNTAANDSGDSLPPVSGSHDQQSDWSAIEQLEAQAKAIATATGCSSSSACRAAPVGSRACGGPRYYIPYCTKTTDSAALYRKLDEIVKAEKAYNAKYQVVSTCEYRMPPVVESVGGSCVAK